MDSQSTRFASYNNAVAISSSVVDVNVIIPLEVTLNSIDSDETDPELEYVLNAGRVVIPKNGEYSVSVNSLALINSGGSNKTIVMQLLVNSVTTIQGMICSKTSAGVGQNMSWSIPKRKLQFNQGDELSLLFFRTDTTGAVNLINGATYIDVTLEKLLP